MPGLPHLRFDTSTLPPAQQFDAWQAAVAVTHDVTPAHPAAAGFAAGADIWHLGPLLLTVGATDAQSFLRTARRARRDGIDHYSVLLMLDGAWQGELGGREVIGGAGSVCLRDMAAPLATSVGRSRHLMVMLPRELLDGTLPAAAGHGLLAAGTPGMLLAEHLRALAAGLPRTTPAEAPAIVQATRDMLRACLAPSSDALAAARPALAIAAQRTARRLIETRLDDPTLTPAALALALGLSRSTLYRLFAPLGGLGAYIRDRRLARVHALLAEPGAGIAALALRHGFASEAHFSRAFRAAFGYSPREARALAVAAARRPAAPAAEAAAEAGYRNWVRGLRD